MDRKKYFGIGHVFSSHLIFVFCFDWTCRCDNENNRCKKRASGVQYCKMFVLKGTFICLYVLFKQMLPNKNCGFSGIQTRINGKEDITRTATTLIVWNIGSWDLSTVWPDLAIYWTLGKFLKPLATINLPKSTTF